MKAYSWKSKRGKWHNGLGKNKVSNLDVDIQTLFFLNTHSLATEKSNVDDQELWKNTANALKGSERRKFMARVVRNLGRAVRVSQKKCLVGIDQPLEKD